MPSAGLFVRLLLPIVSITVSSLFAFLFFSLKAFSAVKPYTCDIQIQIPRLLGGFPYEAFPLAYDYTCMASFLVCVLRHNMHHVDLSVLQAGLPCSCVYPYVPDCLARE